LGTTFGSEVPVGALLGVLEAGADEDNQVILSLDLAQQRRGVRSTGTQDELDFGRQGGRRSNGARRHR